MMMMMMKIKLQPTTDEVQCDRFIVKQVLEGNNYLARDTALQSLNDSLLSVGKSPVKLKRRGQTKHPIAELTRKHQGQQQMMIHKYYNSLKKSSLKLQRKK
jgi:hypothetical protein